MRPWLYFDGNECGFVLLADVVVQRTTKTRSKIMAISLNFCSTFVLVYQSRSLLSDLHFPRCFNVRCQITGSDSSWTAFSYPSMQCWVWLYFSLSLLERGRHDLDINVVLWLMRSGLYWMSCIVGVSLLATRSEDALGGVFWTRTGDSNSVSWT